MSCGCGDGCETCPPTGYICVPRGDTRMIVISVHEDSCTGDLFDISASSEIVFIVSDEFGGTVRITKKLSLGEVSISTNLYQFYFEVNETDTSALIRQTNYFECRVTSALGKSVTVLSGVFKSPNTMIKDI